MTFEQQAHLADQRVNPSASQAWDLVGQLSDECLSWSGRDSNAAREQYQRQATKPRIALPSAIPLDEMPATLLPGWLAIKITFELKTPWYSKDDRPFHVLDNPVRKDRVFGVPFMAAASWKGLLRWACRMEAGLLGHLSECNGLLDGWEEPDWIIHLFGNERGEGEEFSRGALQLFPTWFDRIGFEVINPHSREKKAGTQPIVYEVVPAGAMGHLRLLYVPAPQRDAPPHTMVSLCRALEKLLTVYGFSAKRTAGWGLAEIQKCLLFLVEGSHWKESVAASLGATYEPPSEAVAKLLDESGRPIDLLWNDGALISKTQFRKLGDRKPCTNQELEEFRAWYSTHGDEHQQRLKGRPGDDAPRLVKHDFKSLERLRVVFEKGDA